MVLIWFFLLKTAHHLRNVAGRDNNGRLRHLVYKMCMYKDSYNAEGKLRIMSFVQVCSGHVYILKTPQCKYTFKFLPE